MDNQYSTPMTQRFAGTNIKERRCDMPVIAAIVKCKKCGAEVRSDWKYCPKCADKITCTGKYEACGKK
jgi:Zn finger protein HypA/HybF involved in hydrogenase expression